MRTFAISAIALIGSVINCSAQKVLVQTAELRSNILDTRIINIPDGQILEVLDFFTTPAQTANANDGQDARLETTPGLKSLLAVQARHWDAGSPLSPFRPFMLLAQEGAGFAALQVRAAVGSHVEYFLYYRFIPNVDVSGATQEGQTVVIPSDSPGQVEIKLESSIDLITWTAANPGFYDPDTANRFFRVRAVNAPPNP